MPGSEGVQPSIWRRVWRVGRWTLLALLVAYIGLVIYRIPAMDMKNRSEAMVAEIHAQLLTMNDVDGNHLPPPPDPNLVDATVEGIDANGNGIRDDVELAIFAKYPGDENLKLRAAMLQYAMGLQIMIAKVFSTETWEAAAFQISRGSGCISGQISRNDLEQFIAITDRLTNEVEILEMNTTQRKDAETRAYEYITGRTLPIDNLCDVVAN